MLPLGGSARFATQTLSKCLQRTSAHIPEKNLLMNKSFLAKSKAAEFKGCPGCCLCPVWFFSEARGARYRRPGLAFVAFVRFSQGGAPSDQVQGPFVHLINLKSAAPQRAGLFRGSHLWLRKQKQSRLHAGREAGGKQADESRSEKFSPRVLIGSIFRLQYLAGPIMQFIFPQEDTNDLANLFLWS